LWPSARAASPSSPQRRARAACGLHTLVLGISGGIDSTLAGRLAKLAVQELRADTGDAA